MNIEEIRNLTQRLRCKYPIGPIVNGEPEFGWRDCSGPAMVNLPMPINIEAAEVIDRLTAELKERESEIERLKKEVSHIKEVEFPRRVEKITKTLAAKIQAAESLAAARLADQEAVERHVTKRVAREILLIMEGSESYEDAVSEIRNQYGVE